MLPRSLLLSLTAATEVSFIDLSGLSEEARTREEDRLAHEEALRPFDLARGPLLRLALVRSRRDEHLMLATFHHIVSDGWSRGVLARELKALYGAFAAGRPSPLPPLPVQYADFASWQRHWMAGGAEEAQLAHWRDRLAISPRNERSLNSNRRLAHKYIC